MNWIKRSQATFCLWILTLAAIANTVALAIGAWSTRAAFSQMHAGVQNQAFEIAIWLVCAGLLGLLARISQSRVGNQLSVRVVTLIRDELLRDLARLTHSEYGKKSSGLMINRFSNDLSNITNWLQKGPAAIISSLIGLPVGLVILYWIAPNLWLAGSIPMLLGVAIATLSETRDWEGHREIRKSRGKLSNRLYQSLGNLSLVRISGLLQGERKWLKRRSMELGHWMALRAKANGNAQGVLLFFRFVSVAAILFFAIEGQVNPAEVAAALATLGLIWLQLTQTLQVMELYGRYQAAVTSLEIARSGRRLPRAAVKQNNTATPLVAPEISEECAVLECQQYRGLSKDVPPFTNYCKASEVVFWQTSNDSEAKHLVRCLTGNDSPRSGSILLNGRKLSQYNWNERAKQLTIVQSENLWLRSTTHRNLLFTQAQPIDEQALHNAIAAFDLADDISRLGGLHTRLAANNDLNQGLAGWKVSCLRAYLSTPKALIIHLPAHYDLELIHPYTKKLITALGCSTVIVGVKGWQGLPVDRTLQVGVEKA